MQQELRAIRQQSGDLQVEKRGREQTLSQLQTKIAVLQQELCDKETLVTKSNELLEVANENKVSSYLFVWRVNTKRLKVLFLNCCVHLLSDLTWAQS